MARSGNMPSGFSRSPIGAQLKPGLDTSKRIARHRSRGSIGKYFAADMLHRMHPAAAMRAPEEMRGDRDVLALIQGAGCKCCQEFIGRMVLDGHDIAALCLDKFIDPASGALRENFAADWSPARA